MPRTVATARTVATTRLVIRPYTKSWAFNGTTSKGVSASTVDLSTYNKLVIDFWWNLQYLLLQPVVVELGTGAPNGGFTLTPRFDANKIELFWRDAGGIKSWISGIIKKDTWTHVLAVLDTSGTKLCKTFIAGVSSGTAGADTATGGSNFGNLTLNVGSRNNGASNPTKGSIKDLRITSFTGTWADADAVKFYQNIASFTGASGAVYTPIHQWLGEDDNATPATAADSVGGINLTMTSTTYTADVPTKARLATRPLTGSLSFDGTGDGVKMGNNFSKERTDAFGLSCQCYLRTNSATFSRLLISKCTQNSAAEGYLLYVANATGFLTFELKGSGGGKITVRMNTVFPVNGWHNVAVFYDGSSTATGVRMFVDYIQVPLIIATDTLVASIVTTGEFVVGAFDSLNQSWEGYITDVRLHNANLTTSEYLDMFVNNNPTHVQAAWDFTDGAGSTLTAQTGGVNGTITGATWSTQAPIKARTTVT